MVREDHKTSRSRHVRAGVGADLDWDDEGEGESGGGQMNKIHQTQATRRPARQSSSGLNMHH